MKSVSFTERLARFSALRPWRVVAVWIALLVAGLYLASGLGDVTTTDFKIYAETESGRADDLIEENLRADDPVRELVVIQSAVGTTEDAEYRAFVEDLTAGIRELDTVEGAVNFYETGDSSLVSDNGRTTLIPVALVGEDSDANNNVVPLLELIDEKSGGDFEVLSAGTGSIDRSFNDTAESDLQRAEIFGLPIALLVLVFVFGAIVAAGIPLVLALIAIGVAMGVTALIGQAFELSTFVINFIVTIGLAVGIDYSLLVVQRFREERGRGMEKIEAIGLTGATASRAVLFSGMTVVVALMGMLIVPNNIFRSLAAGAIIVAMLSVLAALTLLPAVLSLLGDRINALSLPFLQRKGGNSTTSGFWVRASHLVMAHPVISVIGAASLLLLAAAPYASIQLGFNGVSTLPEDEDPVRAFAILDSEFSGGLIDPTEIVIAADDVNAPDVQRAIVQLESRLARDLDFASTQLERSEGGEITLVSVAIDGDPSTDDAEAAVKRLRGDYIPDAFRGVDAEVLVTGTTAGNIDGIDMLNDYTAPVLAFVLGLSFLILLVVFRSLVVPAKAIVMNLLSVGASYGLLVLVFQEGFGNEILGFRQVEVIEAWIPLFLFATLFGLSMDYHVFLLSRIREHFEETGNNTESVAFGVASTAGIITGAALIMVAVFAGFASGELVSFQQMGFGLGVAVLLDATIVRTVLVPASMQLLGKWNWYLPSWLDWLPDVKVEGSPLAAVPEA